MSCGRHAIRHNGHDGRTVDTHWYKHFQQKTCPHDFGAAECNRGMRQMPQGCTEESVTVSAACYEIVVGIRMCCALVVVLFLLQGTTPTNEKLLVTMWQLLESE